MLQAVQQVEARFAKEMGAEARERRVERCSASYEPDKLRHVLQYVSIHITLSPTCSTLLLAA